MRERDARYKIADVVQNRDGVLTERTRTEGRNSLEWKRPEAAIGSFRMWSRILREGCVYTLRCFWRSTAFIGHHCCDCCMDSFDLSDVRDRDCRSLPCFFVKGQGVFIRIVGGRRPPRSAPLWKKNMCHDATLTVWSSTPAKGSFPKKGGFSAKCDHVVCFLTTFCVLLPGLAMFPRCVDGHPALNWREESPMLVDTEACWCCFFMTEVRAVVRDMSWNFV